MLGDEVYLGLSNDVWMDVPYVCMAHMSVCMLYIRVCMYVDSSQS